jgi:flavin reductase (DIM6/NTAB) family NADH-FMN oxidoreductase RutF/DNA-binding MarR family transcriptional regulator
MVASNTRFSAREFRDALSSFATGVAVITCLDDQGERVGATASSFNSVSMEPPLILWSISKSAYSADAFIHAERFAVNVLSTEQIHLSNQFARSGIDKFTGVTLRSDPGELPLLEDSLTCFQCRRWATYNGGDHEIIVGQVEALDTSVGSGLVFYRGGYATAEAIQPPIPDIQTENTHFMDNNLLSYLARAHHQMGKEFQQAAVADGLSSKAWSVLSSLYNQSTLEIKDLARQTIIDQNTLLELLIGLQKDGLVRVQQLDTSIQVIGTARGHSRFNQLIETSRTQEQRALQGCLPDACKHLKSLLQHIIDNTDDSCAEKGV